MPILYPFLSLVLSVFSSLFSSKSGVCHGLPIFEEIEHSVKVLDDVCSGTKI